MCVIDQLSGQYHTHTHMQQMCATRSAKWATTSVRACRHPEREKSACASGANARASIAHKCETRTNAHTRTHAARERLRARDAHVLELEPTAPRRQWSMSMSNTRKCGRCFRAACACACEACVPSARLHITAKYLPKYLHACTREYTHTRAHRISGNNTRRPMGDNTR